MSLKLPSFLVSMSQFLFHFLKKKKPLPSRELAVVPDEGGVRISERVSTTVVDAGRPSKIKDDATRLIDIEKKLGLSLLCNQSRKECRRHLQVDD